MMHTEILRVLELGACPLEDKTLVRSFEKESAQASLEMWIAHLRHPDPDGCCIPSVRKALQKSPRSALLYYLLVRLLLQKKAHQEAEYWWSISIKIHPQEPILWMLGGQIALSKDELEAAECHYQTAAHFCSEDDILLRRFAARLDMARACFFWGKGEQEKALFWLRRAQRHDDTWHEPWEALAHYLTSLGCQERASWYAEEARKRKKLSTQLH